MPAILIQAVLITGLLYERWRRRLAEAVSSKRMNELARMSRIATAGELSASIAHEVNQPLAAMVANANAVLRSLANASPDLDDARTALKSVVSDGHRASEIVGSVRAMFKKDNEEKTPLELNDLVQDVIGLMRVNWKLRNSRPNPTQRPASTCSWPQRPIATGDFEPGRRACRGHGFGIGSRAGADGEIRNLSS